MHNFSDLLATKLTIGLTIRLQSVTENGRPDCCVEINGKVFYAEPLDGSKQIVTAVGLTEKICIAISIHNKRYDQFKETAVIIQDLLIDDFNIVPNWTQLAHYHNDHGHNEPTSYLGFNGIWTLDIPQPFYQYRHRITGQGWLLEPTA